MPRPVAKLEGPQAMRCDSSPEANVVSLLISAESVKYGSCYEPTLDKKTTCEILKSLNLSPWQYLMHIAPDLPESKDEPHNYNKIVYVCLHAEMCVYM